mmetsp:Transcript_18899/g.36543  ORF Transcript_18899/g.36543 Transcript_18899/m.36543 type:complete len:92 (-) Transcript_18899:841-1116(-)
MSVAMPAGALRKAKHFDEISEIMGRLALERRKQSDAKAMQQESVPSQEPTSTPCNDTESIAALREQVPNILPSGSDSLVIFLRISGSKPKE